MRFMRIFGNTFAESGLRQAAGDNMRMKLIPGTLPKPFYWQ